jgi:hypothetical protein
VIPAGAEACEFQAAGNARRGRPTHASAVAELPDGVEAPAVGDARARQRADVGISGHQRLHAERGRCDGDQCVRGSPLAGRGGRRSAGGDSLDQAGRTDGRNAVVACRIDNGASRECGAVTNLHDCRRSGGLVTEHTPTVRGCTMIPSEPRPSRQAARGQRVMRSVDSRTVVPLCAIARKLVPMLYSALQSGRPLDAARWCTALGMPVPPPMPTPNQRPSAAARADGCHASRRMTPGRSPTACARRRISPKNH